MNDDENNLDDELQECSSKRRKWWAIKFETGAYYGEQWGIANDDTVDTGFDLTLFGCKKAAETEAARVIDDDWPPYEAVEICISPVS